MKRFNNLFVIQLLQLDNYMLNFGSFCIFLLHIYLRIFVVTLISV